jgi:hypothetical protein
MWLYSSVFIHKYMLEPDAPPPPIFSNHQNQKLVVHSWFSRAVKNHLGSGKGFQVHIENLF